MSTSSSASDRPRVAEPQRTVTTPIFRISQLSLPATGSVVHTLGQISADVLAAWGIWDVELVYAVRMSVRELVGNAVKHGPRMPAAMVFVSFHLEVGGLGPDGVTVTVQDQGTGRLVIPEPDNFDEVEEFRGLTVVSGYGARIDSIVHPAGHSVMAWIPVASADRERVCRCLCWGHSARVPRCFGLVEPGTDTVFIGPCGVPVTVCRACASAITESCLLPEQATTRETTNHHPALATAPGGR